MIFVNQDNSSSHDEPAYTTLLQKIANDGVCPFCSDNLKKYHKKQLIEREFWTITDNMYPYQPTKNHLLLIYKKHIVHCSEIENAAWTELNDIIANQTSIPKIKGGVLLMRFGDTQHTGASIAHLHIHIVESDPADPSYDHGKGISVRIG